MFRLLTEPKIYELIKNEIFWGMDIHLSDWRTVVHLLTALKCTLAQFIPFPHRIEVGFEPAVHVDGIDRDICPVFENIIQDDLGWNEHVSFFQFLRKLVDRFDWDIDDKIQILSRTRFSPCPFRNSTANQVFNPSSIQRFDH